MIRLLILLTIIHCYNAFSKDQVLKCQASYNTDVILETEVSLKKGEQNKLFGELAGLQFFLSDKGNNSIEVQAVNNYEPSRNYASAKFVDPSSFLELSIWKRDYLLEVRCRR
jgi:hypothetical protein